MNGGCSGLGFLEDQIKTLIGAIRTAPDLQSLRVVANENIQVNLVMRIPILIVYGTAAVNEGNQIRFFDDIYGYDAALEKALAAGYPEAW